MTDALKDRLRTLRQTARYLLQQAAAHGGEVHLPADRRHSLDETRRAIAVCKAELRAHGVVVDDELEDATPAVPGRSLAGGVFQLRAPAADFVGRDAELDRLVRALRPGQSGRAAIGGVRGMGGCDTKSCVYLLWRGQTAHNPVFYHW